MEKIFESKVLNGIIGVIVFLALCYFVGIFAFAMVKVLFYVGLGLFVVLFIILGWGINYAYKSIKQFFKKN